MLFSLKRFMPAAVIWPIISIAVLFLARMVELGTKRPTIRGPVKESLSLRLFIAVGALMFASSTAEFWFGHKRLQGPSFIAGWICAIVSVVIRHRAIAALGQFWSLHIEIREQHQFVRTGPFRWMRHPTYFSMFLELLAAGLILNAWFSLLIIPLLFFPVLRWRIKWEETALVEKFGEAYRQYQQTVPAIFPI